MDANFHHSDVLGVKCAVSNLDSAADSVIARARAGSGGYVVLCNVHVLMTAQKEPLVLTALEDAWAVLPDGAPIAWVQRRTGYRCAARIPGPDLMPLVVDRGRRKRIRHFLFGSTPTVVATLRNRLERRFQGVEIVGAYAPPVGGEDDPAWLGAISRADPHVIWCALGAPKQELWMHRHSQALKPALVLGVGAAFDFLAGAKPRAPLWMQRTGFEWLHRMCHEPRRLGGRYASTNAAYAVRALRLIGMAR